MKPRNHTTRSREGLRESHGKTVIIIITNLKKLINENLNIKPITHIAGFTVYFQ